MRYVVVVLVCCLLLLIVARLVASKKRRGRFISFGFLGIDGKPPRLTHWRKVNNYVRTARFKSLIPYEYWVKNQPQLEVIFDKKILDVERVGSSVRKVDILFMRHSLPSRIDWEDKYMVDGPRFAIGEGYYGKVIWDAVIHPHGMVSGSSGVGKSGILRCIISQAQNKKWNILLLDPKHGGDFSEFFSHNQYGDLEKGYGSFIVTDPEEVRNQLLALTVEVGSRMDAFREAGVSNIYEYIESKKGSFVPWLLVVDEAAELFDVNSKNKEEKELYAEIDHLFRKLARTSRAAGVHILLCFIRPDSNVLDGQIKNCITYRICGYFPDPAASRIVLDNDRATELAPDIKGRFIVGDQEVQAYYFPTRPENEGQDGRRSGA